MRVIATLIGDGGAPRATRSARRAAERTSRRGSSAAIVAAPTRIASAAARSASTRSRSSAFDRISRSGVASSMWPSSEVATDSST